jgi:hypothetical protein
VAEHHHNIGRIAPASQSCFQVTTAIANTWYLELAVPQLMWLTIVPMLADRQKTEEQLRSELYAALTELSFARAHEKAAIVERMRSLCGELHQLIKGDALSE